MKHRRWFLRLLAGSLTLGCLAAGTGPAAAVEESQRFLDGLRERGYFDVALEYLEQMRNSPLATQEFKETIDYEAGVTLITASRTGRVTSIREKQLGQARDKFRTFIDRHPDSPLVAGANTQLANLLVERGRIKTEQASKPNRSAEEKKSLLSEARELYQEAEKVFKASEQRFVEEHKK